MSEHALAAQPPRHLIDTGPSRRGWHRLELASRCMQLYAYRYKLQPGTGGGSDGAGFVDESMPLIRGTLGHIGLAHYYARLMCQQNHRSPDLYYEPMEAMDLKARLHGGMALEVLDAAKLAVQDYMANYLMDRLRIIAVESPGEMTLGGHLVTQRFDLVVLDSAGRYWIYDHKFVGNIEGKSVTRYTLSGQFLLMQWMGRHHFGDKFGGVRINLIGVENRKFLRATPEPAPWALSRFPATVAELEARIAAHEGLNPWEYPKATSEVLCMTPYGPCPGLDLCRWGPSTTA